ncbi:hypothetical protein Aph02nite_86220 [Actinoplanes philippinensis]|uniref:DUF2191 domain-containing protein n=1 Tax=Actinoplanes philippinensis TaxID=35752 RepID=A0A1I2LR14_9ACTN|nr:hypothetical protein [Actinoplanes philippinensis]GIE82672.1 hypothetical protein Aph02nite_86220 [Actinoplanes philippinensis]SFF80859.1 hypothetical protein SAMN05421541_12326 [Actinoplanes philippinensis]
MVKRLVEVDREALAEAAAILGTNGVQETVAAALAEMATLHRRVREHDDELARRRGDHPMPENYQ